MPRKKKPYNLTRKIVTELRKIHRGWPNSYACVKISEVEVIGEGGKKKKLVRCKACHELFRREIIRRDHIDPVGTEPEFIDKWKPSWDVYIARMFSPVENYQPLCLDCHDKKTKEERKKKCQVKS